MMKTDDDDWNDLKEWLRALGGALFVTGMMIALMLADMFWFDDMLR